MGVLFLMPNWFAPSELSMQRMIEALEPHVVAIAAHAPTESLWRGRVPTLPLFDAPLALGQLAAYRRDLPVQDIVEKATFQALRKAVDGDSVTVVLAHYLNLALRFEGVWANTSKPLFVHCHGYDITWDHRRHEDPFRPFFRPDYVPSVLRLSQRATIIAASQFAALQLVKAGVPADRVVVKNIGVPVSDAPTGRSQRTSGLDILYLDRLVDFKGPDIVIRAFELACEKGLDGHLTMAGDGPLRAMCELLRARSKYADRIILLGAVDAAKGEQLRAQADIFTAHNCPGLLSQQQEAFDVPVVEAMASALPVVSGGDEPLAETVVHGETGLLIEPGDVEAHAEALLQLARDPDVRLQMGAAGWRRAKEHFSSEKERVELLHILGLERQVSQVLKGLPK
jgi:glycosyltransferase involved in cell wall biosynthesis